MPGPKGAGWSEAGNRGFNEVMQSSHLSLVDTLWGDTGLKAQTTLLKDQLQKSNDIQYIVGTAVSAESAISLTRRYSPDVDNKIISYYFSPGVYRGITRGDIVAAPSDEPVLQSELAVDIAVKALENISHPKHISAKIKLFTIDNVDALDLSGALAPEGFRPVFNVE